MQHAGSLQGLHFMLFGAAAFRDTSLASCTETAVQQWGRTQSIHPNLCVCHCSKSMSQFVFVADEDSLYCRAFLVLYTPLVFVREPFLPHPLICNNTPAQLLVEPNNPVEFLAGGCFILNKPFMFLLLLFPSILQTRNQEREEP